MTREEAIKTIRELVEKEAFLSKTDWENKRQCGTDNHKKGLYFLYNKEKDCIYVGKVGDGLFTSFYHRMYGHGWGAHKRQPWYENVVYAKWHKFDLTGDKLALIERLAIVGMGQPVYNDICTDQNAIETLSELKKS